MEDAAQVAVHQLGDVQRALLAQFLAADDLDVGGDVDHEGLTQQRGRHDHDLVERHLGADGDRRQDDDEIPQAGRSTSAWARRMTGRFRRCSERLRDATK